MNAPSPVSISPVEEIVADMRAGRIVILVDEEDRENEGHISHDLFDRRNGNRGGCAHAKTFGES